MNPLVFYFEASARHPISSSRPVLQPASAAKAAHITDWFQRVNTRREFFFECVSDSENSVFVTSRRSLISWPPREFARARTSFAAKFFRRERVFEVVTSRRESASATTRPERELSLAAGRVAQGFGRLCRAALHFDVSERSLANLDQARRSRLERSFDVFDTLAIDTNRALLNEPIRGRGAVCKPCLLDRGRDPDALAVDSDALCLDIFRDLATLTARREILPRACRPCT